MTNDRMEGLRVAGPGPDSSVWYAGDLGTFPDAGNEIGGAGTLIQDRRPADVAGVATPSVPDVAALVTVAGNDRPAFGGPSRPPPGPETLRRAPPRRSYRLRAFALVA